jgi:hypothetical protein
MGGIGTPELILILVVPLILFFIFRQIMLWYWKITVLIENQQRQTALLERQNELTYQQNQLLQQLRMEISNSAKDPNSNR